MIEKLRILGSDYVGAWGTATDKFFIGGYEVSEGEKEIIKKTLKVECFRTSVGGSGLLGIYVAANSKGILLPYGTEDRELDALRKQIPEARVEIFNTEYNALKNNILSNDRIAIINPNYSKEEENKIADVLDVETHRVAVANYHTVGAHNILTNRGMVVNNRASEQEIKKVDEITGMNAEQSTANLGSLSIGICVIANSNGLVVGRATTGFELSRIAESLEIE